MAVYTAKRFFQAQPTTSYATQYTVPGGVSCIVKEIVVANVTAGSVSFDLSLVASGGTAGVTNNVIPNAVVPAYSTVIYTFTQVLATGGFISMKAGAGTSLTVTCSGVEFV